jgi:hypothetical protein
MSAPLASGLVKCRDVAPAATGEGRAPAGQLFLRGSRALRRGRGSYALSTPGSALSAVGTLVGGASLH